MNCFGICPSRLSATLGIVILAACQSTAPSALEPPSSYEAGDLLVRVELDAPIVKRGSEFTVQAMIENNGDQATGHSAPGACPWSAQVLRKGVDVTELFTESIQVCLAMTMSYSVPAGGMRSFPKKLTAGAPPGEYQVIVRWAMAPAVEQVATRFIVR